MRASAIARALPAAIAPAALATAMRAPENAPMLTACPRPVAEDDIDRIAAEIAALAEPKELVA